MIEYMIRYNKTSKYPWEVYDKNGHSASAPTRQIAINQYLALYGKPEFQTNIDVESIDKKALQ